MRRGKTGQSSNGWCSPGWRSGTTKDSEVRTLRGASSNYPAAEASLRRDIPNLSHNPKLKQQCRSSFTISFTPSTEQLLSRLTRGKRAVRSFTRACLLRLVPSRMQIFKDGSKLRRALNDPEVSGAARWRASSFQGALLTQHFNSTL